MDPIAIARGGKLDAGPAPVVAGGGASQGAWALRARRGKNAKTTGGVPIGVGRSLSYVVGGSPDNSKGAGGAKPLSGPAGDLLLYSLYDTLQVFSPRHTIADGLPKLWGQIQPTAFFGACEDGRDSDD